MREILPFFRLIAIIITAFSCNLVYSSDSNYVSLIYKIELKDEITPGIARQFSKAIMFAKEKKSSAILIHMNTYGGQLDAADSIRTLILNCQIPTIVFIDNNAASAGALISIACTKIFMKTGANIGAATVVNENAEALPDKYQSYMRSMMRSTAETRGRNPLIAEAMVDPRTFIPGINDSGKVLTFTTTEAIKNGYCNGLAETNEDVLKQSGFVNYKIESFEPSIIDRIIGFLISPAISGILILVMLGGLYYELQHPGIGIPIILAVIAAILYFAPLYLEGFAQNWEILISIAGLLLLIAEIFIIPGFGFAGISGILLLLFGLTTSLLRNDGFDFSGVSTIDIYKSISIVMASIAGALALFIVSSKVFVSSPLFKKMVLADQQSASSGYTSAIHEYEILVGQTAITQTLLRPSGTVQIGHHSYTATCESGFINQDVEVDVIGVKGNMLVVSKR